MRGRGKRWRGEDCAGGKEGIGGSGYEEQVRRHEVFIYIKEFDKRMNK